MFWIALLACTGSDTQVPTAPTDTDVPTDTAPPIPTADTAPVDPYDCAHPPETPTDFTVLQGFGNSEDFDFDRNGNHVSVNANGNLIARDMQGNQTLLAANLSWATACTRRLPDGDFVVCDVANNSLLRVDAISGSRTTLLSGLAYPNGAEVDAEGFVYLAEENAGRIRRINSETGDATVVATGLSSPNGVIFSPDYQTLYVGSFGAGRIYAIDRTGPDTFTEPRILAAPPGLGTYDGINVDACGNVYVSEYTSGLLGRISPDGLDIAIAAELPSSWIPNMRWGNGVGGWDENTLYVSDREQGRLFAMHIGIPGKPDFPDP